MSGRFERRLLLLGTTGRDKMLTDVLEYPQPLSLSVFPMSTIHIIQNVSCNLLVWRVWLDEYNTALPALMGEWANGNAIVSSMILHC